MATIIEAGRGRGPHRLKSYWRDKLVPAHFRGAMFHVEAGGKSSGRRTVVHEFPKRNVPYAEDMGRRAVEWSVRGYLICFVDDTESELYRRDYTLQREKVIAALEQDGYGPLQLPLLPPMTVMCQRYRVTEEEKLGGYCVFDMEFVEFGKPPLAGPPMSDAQLKAQSDALKARTIQALANYDTELLGRKTTPTPAGPSVPISEIIPIGPTIPGPGP